MKYLRNYLSTPRSLVGRAGTRWRGGIVGCGSMMRPIGATVLVFQLVGLVLFPVSSLLPKRSCTRGSWKLLRSWYPRRR